MAKKATGRRSDRAKQKPLATMEDEFKVPKGVQDAADNYNRTMLASNRAKEKFNAAKINLLDQMAAKEIEAVRVLKEGGGDRILRHTVKHGIKVEVPKKKNDDD